MAHFLDYMWQLWLALGLFLVILEFFVPGLVALFLGIAAIILAPIVYMGMLPDPAMQIFVWALLSAFLVLTLRSAVARWFPSLEGKGYLSLDEEWRGREVEVIETVTPDSSEGRVRFQGTTWIAVSSDRNIEKGEKALIVMRDNLTLIVESQNNRSTE